MSSPFVYVIVKLSEAAMSDKFDVIGDTHTNPFLALDKEKRKVCIEIQLIHI